MLTHFFLSMAGEHTWLNIFRYVTFRGVLAVMTALALGVFVFPYTIRKLTQYSIGEVTRDDDVPMHSGKGGTPTMGGVIIILSVCIAVLLWADLNVRFVWIVLMGMLGFAVIGFIDDWIKLKSVINGTPRGLSVRVKLLMQIVTAAVIALALYMTATSPVDTAYIVPVLKDISLDFGIWFIPLTMLVIVATSNATNLTDGLDGLAILPIVMVAGGLGVFSYATGHSVFSQYLAIPFIEGAGELAIFCASIVGGGLAFLAFNCHPAQIFMGDVGALALGTAIAVVAVAVRQELVLFVMGGLFVLEAVSVITQVISYKLFGRRIWLMSPLHHHLELKQWPETRITVRLWIVSFVLVLSGLATLKIR
ncbi:MAG: phospho-N-acetylmuramoyl-pentapeptide-transferase [Acidiferrobacterales bacterium]|nr:phospho-N-acetylmuramoyl-pentapeptide-transferase [Acidiferrobacterales bacterium]